MSPSDWQQTMGVVADLLGEPPGAREAVLTDRFPDLLARRQIELLLRNCDAFAATSDDLPYVQDRRPLRPDMTLGPYVVTRQIGEGAMGAVFLGEDSRLQRPVALKSLTRIPAEGIAVRNALQREARACALITHPNIAMVHDVIEHGAGAVLVMEYVEGETLASHLRRQHMTQERALTVGRQLASALSAAHLMGVIHRDFKPANIQITPSGYVKVLDFGIATALASLSGVEGSSTANRRLHIGTLGYMSPEQLVGGEIGPQTDVFSLGVVLYEMLVGCRPFEGDDVLRLLGSLMRGMSPSDRLHATVPPELASVIATALALDPGERFASAVELSEQLEALVEHKRPAPSVASALPQLADDDAMQRVRTNLIQARAALDEAAISGASTVEVTTRSAGMPPFVMRSIAGALVMAAGVGGGWLALRNRAPRRVAASAASAQGPAALQIENVLREYAAAYSRGDVAAIRRVYPGVDEPKLTAALGATPGATAALTDVRVSAAGDIASATATWHVQRAGQTGSADETRESVRFRLRHSPDGGWIIADAP